MKHLKNVTKPQVRNIPKSASLPFAKCCLMSGGRLEDGGEYCRFSSDASRGLFELLATVKGVPYTID